jgi:hypothetical protein
MSEEGVTAPDAVRWLHSEGLVRLAAVGARVPNPVAAYTVDIETGTVTAHPATSTGQGTDVVTLSADDLPRPDGTPGRLLVAGITTVDAILVLDLAVTDRITINGDRPESAARSWTMQLLLNSDITITTNSIELAIADSPRCRHGFIPGAGATILNVDDKHPPVSTVTLNAPDERIDHLDIAVDGSAELYLGARFWSLRRVMQIDDGAWAELAARLAMPDIPAPTEPETENSL